MKRREQSNFQPSRYKCIALATEQLLQKTSELYGHSAIHASDIPRLIRVAHDLRFRLLATRRMPAT